MVTTEEEAIEKAKELVRRLNGYFGTDAWKDRVLGYKTNWKYMAHLGSISVLCDESEDTRPKYTAYVRCEKDFAGGSLDAWFDERNSDHELAVNPEMAVMLAMETAEEYVKGLQSIIDSNWKLLNTLR